MHNFFFPSRELLNALKGEKNKTTLLELYQWDKDSLGFPLFADKDRVTKSVWE